MSYSVTCRVALPAMVISRSSKFMRRFDQTPYFFLSLQPDRLQAVRVGKCALRKIHHLDPVRDDLDQDIIHVLGTPGVHIRPVCAPVLVTKINAPLQCSCSEDG